MTLLESPLVGITLFIGGVICFLLINGLISPSIKEEKEISYLTALKIGFFQCWL
jgi:undecaprenyl-diphosphatase